MNDLRTSDPICAETEPQPRERRKRKLLAKRRKLIEGQIYFARSGDMIKIGFSTNAESRIATLQTAHFEPLALLTTIDGNQRGERALHHRFRRMRVRGEWFRADPELLEYIERVNAKPEPAPVHIVIKPTLPRDQAKLLTKVRGFVRRLPDGVEMEQLSLLAAQIENQVPQACIKRQLAIIATTRAAA
jgi:hypothetical protein